MADVEDSTGHLSDLGDRYQRLLSDVRRLLRTATRRAGGREVDARADEFFAAFSDPIKALEAAVAMQRAFETHTWTDGRSVRARIGLHIGRPTLTVTGYVGIAVNTVARVAAMGHGAQILASWSVREAVGDADGIGWRTLGLHRLRGIPDEHELLQVEAADLPIDFPPLRASR